MTPGPCPCECNSGRECGGCGHAGCGQVAGWVLLVKEWHPRARRAPVSARQLALLPESDGHGTQYLT